MATLTTSTSNGFSNTDLWVANASVSQSESFQGLQSSTGNPLLGQQTLTYTDFTFEANGLSYTYRGAFTVTIDRGLLTGSVSASGSYDTILVSNGADPVASYQGTALAVDFGNRASIPVLDLVLGLVGTLLVGGVNPAPNDSPANLYLDRTPNLVDIAFQGNDALQGDSGNDTLNGSTGNDVILGGLGADIMTGGTGDDIYFVDNVGDQVVEAASGGFDVVNSTITYSLGATVEGLELFGTTNIDGIGNNLNNIIFGNAGNNKLMGDAGNDVLLGRDGNDSLFGGDGDDRLDGGAGTDGMLGGSGNDVYVVDSVTDVVIESVAGGLDIIETTVNGLSLANIANVEAIVLTGSGNLSAFGDSNGNFLYGNGGDNTLYGEAGNDLLDGGAGNDTLYGGDGADNLRAGAGNDFLYGGAGADAFIFSGSGRDLIGDFNAGASVDDFIQLQRSDFADLNAVVAAMSQDSFGNTIIAGPNGSSILIEGVAMSQLYANDFLIV